MGYTVRLNFNGWFAFETPVRLRFNTDLAVGISCQSKIFLVSQYPNASLQANSHMSKGHCRAQASCLPTKTFPEGK